MRRSLVLLPLLSVLVVVPSAPPDGARRADAQSVAVSRSGTLEGARYRIDVPRDWRGGLRLRSRLSG